jgi:hypothetical protein
VEDACQPPSDAAQGILVFVLAIAELVVVGAGAGRCDERGHCLGVQRVDEVAVTDVPGVHGFFFPDWMVRGDVPA